MASWLSATLTMMFIYSKQLAAVVLVAFALYVLLRLALYRMLRNRALNEIHAKAKEESNFIETVRAIQSIKIFNQRKRAGDAVAQSLFRRCFCECSAWPGSGDFQDA